MRAVGIERNGLTIGYCAGSIARDDVRRRKGDSGHWLGSRVRFSRMAGRWPWVYFPSLLITDSFLDAERMKGTVPGPASSRPKIVADRVAGDVPVGVAHIFVIVGLRLDDV